MGWPARAWESVRRRTLASGTQRTVREAALPHRLSAAHTLAWPSRVFSFSLKHRGLKLGASGLTGYWLRGPNRARVHPFPSRAGPACWGLTCHQPPYNGHTVAIAHCQIDSKCSATSSLYCWLPNNTWRYLREASDAVTSRVGVCKSKRGTRLSAPGCNAGARSKTLHPRHSAASSASSGGGRHQHRSLPLNWCRYVDRACSSGLTSQHFSAGPSLAQPWQRGRLQRPAAVLRQPLLSCFSVVAHRAGARVRGAALPHRLYAARTLA